MAGEGGCLWESWSAFSSRGAACCIASSAFLRSSATHHGCDNTPTEKTTNSRCAGRLVMRCQAEETGHWTVCCHIPVVAHFRACPAAGRPGQAYELPKQPLSQRKTVWTSPPIFMSRTEGGRPEPWPAWYSHGATRFSRALATAVPSSSLLLGGLLAFTFRFLAAFHLHAHTMAACSSACEVRACFILVQCILCNFAALLHDRHRILSRARQRQSPPLVAITPTVNRISRMCQTNLVAESAPHSLCGRPQVREATPASKPRQNPGDRYGRWHGVDHGRSRAGGATAPSNGPHAARRALLWVQARHPEGCEGCPELAACGPGRAKE